MAIQEGLWDCEYCGTTGIKGRHKICPTCQQRRQEGVTFYLPEDAEDVTEDEEHLQRAKAGADWICEYCSASNSNLDTVCHHCGQEREDTSVQQEVKEYGTDDIPNEGDEAPRRPPPPPEPESEPSKGFKRFIPFVAAGIGVLLLFCVVFYFLVIRTTETTATINNVSWERTIDVEELRTVTEEGKSIPPGGRKIREYQEQEEEEVKVGTEEYVCGKRDLGNGYFEDKICTRDVYETQYRNVTIYEYEIDKWVKDRTERKSGTDFDPAWPKVSYSSKERERGRHETYTLHCKDTTESKTYDINIPNENEWKQYEIGQKLDLKVNALGNATIVK